MSSSSPAAAGEAGRQCLSFSIAGEVCAVDLQCVHEIVYVDALTRIPNVHPCIRGVVNLRGTVVPVIDVGRGLALSDAVAGAQLCLIVVELRIAGDAATLGLVVEDVRQAFDLAPQDVESVPGFGTRIPPSYLQGVVKRDGAFISMLDLDALLSDGALFRQGPQNRRGAA